MKRLVLITLLLVTVAIAEVLRGHYTQHEIVEEIALKVAYGAYYPEGIPTITLIPATTIPF